jgi:hypothetical protein
MRRTCIALLALALCPTSGAFAADMPVKAYKAPPVVGCANNAITAANNQISLDYATTSLDYVEYNPSDPVFANPAIPAGAALDSEKNWLPGVTGTGSAMFNVGSVCNVYVFGRASYFSGNTNYWEATGPLGITHSSIWEDDFRVGKGFDLAPNWMLTPYLGGGYRDWVRNLCQGGACFGGGYHEDYSNGYVGAGLMVQFAATPQLVLTGSGLVGSTVGSQLDGGPLTNGLAGIVPFSTSLGNSVMYKIEGSADYAFTQQIHGNVGIEYTNFKYGQSGQFFDGLGPAIEPNSRTQTITVRAGLGYAFAAAPVVAKY